MPGGCQGARFRFPVSDYGRDDEVGVVECGAAGVRENVSELASFMDRAWCLGSAVTADTTWEGELSEEFLQSGRVFALIRVNLRVSALQVCRSQNSGRAVPRSRHEDHVQVEYLDQAVQMNVCE